jgi:hypothetical protein
MSDLKSPLRTIRLHCISCNGTANEVGLCPVVKCLLYPYRFGKDPRRVKRELTDEQRKSIRERFAKKHSPLIKGEINQGDE